MGTAARLQDPLPRVQSRPRGALHQPAYHAAGPLPHPQPLPLRHAPLRASMDQTTWGCSCWAALLDSQPLILLPPSAHQPADQPSPSPRSAPPRPALPHCTWP
jgi:hypothetical protein